MLKITGFVKALMKDITTCICIMLFPFVIFYDCLMSLFKAPCDEKCTTQPAKKPKLCYNDLPEEGEPIPFEITVNSEIGGNMECNDDPLLNPMMYDAPFYVKFHGSVSNGHSTRYRYEIYGGCAAPGTVIEKITFFGDLFLVGDDRSGDKSQVDIEIESQTIVCVQVVLADYKAVDKLKTHDSCRVVWGYSTEHEFGTVSWTHDVSASNTYILGNGPVDIYICIRNPNARCGDKSVIVHKATVCGPVLK